MPFPFEGKGCLLLRREAIQRLVLDPFMTYSRKGAFIELLRLATPVEYFEFVIKDGGREKRITLEKGTLVTNIKELSMKLGCCTKTTLMFLRELHKNDYIEYKPPPNQHQNLFIKVKDFDYYVLSQSELERIGVEKIFLPISEEKISEPNFKIERKIFLTNIVRPKDLLYEAGLKQQKERYDRDKRQLEEDVVIIQNLFFKKVRNHVKDKNKAKIKKEICEKLLEKFLLNHILKNIRGMIWGRHIDNPVGVLIDNLESSNELSITQSELEEEMERRRKEEQKRVEEKPEREKFWEVMKGLKKRIISGSYLLGLLR